MREEIRTMIHELDQAADEIRNPALLEAAADVRKVLKDLSEDESEGLVSYEWMKRMYALWTGDHHGKQTISGLLCELTEPEIRFATEILPNTSDGIRRMCRIQRNRMRFVRKLTSCICKLKSEFPEAERQEEEEKIRQEDRLALEGLDHLLELYRQKAMEEQSMIRLEKIHFLERYEMGADEKQHCIEAEERNWAQHVFLHETEDFFQNICESRRTNQGQTGLNRCIEEERGEKSVRRDERICESDKE